MLNLILEGLWGGIRFLYFHNMTKSKKRYIQKRLAEKLQELRTSYSAEELSFSFMIKAEEFLVWAKENQEVPSIWERLFIAVYTVYLKIDLLLCKLVYGYFYDEHEKVGFRNAIADLMYECKSEEYQNWDMCKVKLKHLEDLYTWLCENQ